MAERQGKNGFLALARNGDVMMALGLIGILLLMVVPLPAFPAPHSVRALRDDTCLCLSHTCEDDDHHFGCHGDGANDQPPSSSHYSPDHLRHTQQGLPKPSERLRLTFCKQPSSMRGSVGPSAPD